MQTELGMECKVNSEEIKDLYPKHINCNVVLLPEISISASRHSMGWLKTSKKRTPVEQLKIRTWHIPHLLIFYFPFLLLLVPLSRVERSSPVIMLYPSHINLIICPYSDSRSLGIYYRSYWGWSAIAHCRVSKQAGRTKEYLHSCRYAPTSA